MKTQHIRFAAVGLILACLGAVALGAPIPGDILASVGMLGCVGNIDLIMKELDKIEPKLAALATKADMEAKFGEISADTKSQIEGLGTKQRELADRLLSLEQKGTAQNDADTAADTWGQQFIKSDIYTGRHAAIVARRQVGSVVADVKNTVVTSDVTVAPDRRPGIVGGAFRRFTLEDVLNAAPTSAAAVEYTRENVWTNNAAEVAEGSTMAESSITFTLETATVQSIAHFIKISRQLAADGPALAAYIDTRMRHGVNLRVENQLYAGNGSSPNLSGLNKSGNYTAHGYTAAALTALGLSPTNRIDLIGKVIGDCWAADYPANAILLNPSDWWTLRLTKDSQGRYLLGDPGEVVDPMLFGVPVVQSNAVTADTFQIGAYDMAATKYDREAVTVDMSDSDGDNFVKQLVTLRATRRLALAVERPASIRGGDLTPG